MPDLSRLRILADEDVSFKLIRPLKALGADILTADKGLKNGKLFKFAVSESRILLTHDADFADPFRYPASRTHGVIIMKIHPPVEKDLLTAVQNLFEKASPESLKGKLIWLYKKGFEVE